MSRVLLTIFCAAHDAEAIAVALRNFLHAPVHMRREDVLGRDFADAGTAEHVAGALVRTVLDVELPENRVRDAIEAATAARRRLPFRWRTVAVLDGGRVK